MDSSAKKHLATRIHYALLRYLETGIDADRMLRDGDYAREVLYVCEGSRDDVLQDLGRQFAGAGTAPKPASRTPARVAHAQAAAVAAARPGVNAMALPNAAPQDATWAQDTSGFGFVVPSDFEDERIERQATQSRFSLPRWLRRDGRRQ